MSSFLSVPNTMQNSGSTGERARSLSPSPNKLHISGGGVWRSHSTQPSIRGRSPSVCSKNGRHLSMAPMANFDFKKGSLDKSEINGNDRSQAPIPATKAACPLSACPTDAGGHSEPEASPVDVTTDNSHESLSEGDHELSRSWAMWEKTVQPGEEQNFSDETDPDTTPDSMRVKTSYSACISHVKTFDKIETFMPLFNGIPPPSTIVNQNHIYRQLKSPFFDFTTTEEESSCSDDEISSIITSKRSSSILGRSPLPFGLKREMKQLDAVMFFESGVSPVWEDAAHQNGGVMEFTFKTDFPAEILDEIWERLLFTVLGNGFDQGDFVTGIRMADRLPSNLIPTLPIVCVRFEIWHREMDPDMAQQLRAEIVELITTPTIYGGQVITKRPVQKGEFATKTPVIYVRRAPAFNERDVRRNDKRGSV